MGISTVADDRRAHELRPFKQLVLLGAHVVHIAQQIDVRVAARPVDELIHTADGAQHAVKFSAGHTVAQQVDLLHADAALLEISLSLLRVKALRAAEDLNVQYRTSMSHRPFAGAVSPASARQRASNSAGRLSAGRLPRPTSSSVPTRMRAM